MTEWSGTGRIRQAEATDVDAYRAHNLRHLAESGQPGSPIFAPVVAGERPRDPDRDALLLAGWARPVSEPGWRRAWVLVADDRVVASLDLLGPSIASGLHRATMQMGVELAYRGQGHGKALLREAIAWAKVRPSLTWLDLRVFAHNQPAMSLYRSFGFREIGRIDDCFRLAGQVIDDVQMALRLER